MNQNETSKPFSILKSAKLVLFNFMFLSTASLLAPSAFALSSGYDNLSECMDINSNLPRYITVKGHASAHDLVDLKNEWTFSWYLPGYPSPAYAHFPKDQNGLTKFKLTSIKITTKPYDLKKDGRDNVAFPVIKTVSCEYQDPSGVVPGSLYLNLKESGKISVGDKTLAEKDMDGDPITDRTVSYVSRGGQVLAKTKWTYDKNAATVTDFNCSEKNSTNANWITQCGGWSMNRKIQNNGFWTNAYTNCWNAGWQRCYFNGLLWSYSKDLLAKHNKWTVDIISVNKADDAKCNLATKITRRYQKYHEWFECEVPNPTTAYCKDAKCEAEITAVNNTIGKYTDGREGMGWYTRRCWANENNKVIWKNKQWDKRFENCSDLRQPSGDWPSYSHLSTS